METARVLSKACTGTTRSEKDASHCGQCQEIWTIMKQRDEEELKRIVDHLAYHFQDELKVKLSA